MADFHNEQEEDGGSDGGEDDVGMSLEFLNCPPDGDDNNTAESAEAVSAGSTGSSVSPLNPFDTTVENDEEDDGEYDEEEGGEENGQSDLENYEEDDDGERAGENVGDDTENNDVEENVEEDGEYGGEGDQEDDGENDENDDVEDGDDDDDDDDEDVNGKEDDEEDDVLSPPKPADNSLEFSLLAGNLDETAGDNADDSVYKSTQFSHTSFSEASQTIDDRTNSFDDTQNTHTSFDDSHINPTEPDISSLDTGLPPSPDAATSSQETFTQIIAGNELSEQPIVSSQFDVDSFDPSFLQTSTQVESNSTITAETGHAELDSEGDDETEEPPSKKSRHIDESDVYDNEGDGPMTPGRQLNDDDGDDNDDNDHNDNDKEGDNGPALDELSDEGDFEGFDEEDLAESSVSSRAVGGGQSKSDDKEPAPETSTNLIADIFGESDEEGDFEGFDEGELGPAAVGRDDEDEDMTTTVTPGEAAAVASAVVSDEEAEFAEQKPQEPSSDIVWDFDTIMERKKQENRARSRRKRNYDIINDSDDVVAQIIEDMKQAAADDRELRDYQMTATKKIAMLPLIQDYLLRADLSAAFVDLGVLNAIADWLSPLPNHGLPALQIRCTLLKCLKLFHIENPDNLKSSGIGKALMYLYKHPKELPENKRLAGSLIHQWSRLIFNNTADFGSLTRDEREARDMEQLPQQRRLSDGSKQDRGRFETVVAGGERRLKPGDPGFCARARVPAPSIKDYVYRPKSGNDEVELPRKSTRRPIDDRLGKYNQRMMELKRIKNRGKAAKFSIEGNKMAI